MCVNQASKLGSQLSARLSAALAAAGDALLDGDNAVGDGTGEDNEVCKHTLTIHTAWLPCVRHDRLGQTSPINKQFEAGNPLKLGVVKVSMMCSIFQNVALFPIHRQLSPSCAAHRQRRTGNQGAGGLHARGPGCQRV